MNVGFTRKDILTTFTACCDSFIHLFTYFPNKENKHPLSPSFSRSFLFAAFTSTSIVNQQASIKMEKNNYVSNSRDPPPPGPGSKDNGGGLHVHSQVDYVHRLVPDMLSITNCSFYWGKMDRYEAERLLEDKPEGTFLLRDSAQEEHLFSVSFRRFERSLHARIEQGNDRFSFDSRDPGVYSSKTVCGLIEHYKDPSHCMFFEPMLTLPLHRKFPFSLQALCRASISSLIKYDDINSLDLPQQLKVYLKEYHYKQLVRSRRLD